MIIAPVGSIQGGLSGVGGLTQSTAANPSEAVTGAEGLTGTEASSAAEGTQSSTPSFGTALTEAVSSLETSQSSSDAASQALATGSVTDPEQAVSTVEDASLEMELAAQIRGKASEAVQTIFATQV